MGLWKKIKDWFNPPTFVVEERAPAPCGDKEEHYYWVDEGWPCPDCAAKKRNAQDALRKEVEGDALAAKVIEKLRKGGLL